MFKKILTASAITASLTLLVGCQTPNPQTREITGGKPVTNTAAPSGTEAKKTTVELSTTTIAAGGGKTERPDGVPADLQNLPNGTDFSWKGSGEIGTFSFAVKGTDPKDVCNQELDLLANAGWSYKPELSVEYSNAVVKGMKKNGYILSTTCSANQESGRVDVFLVKGTEQ